MRSQFVIKNFQQIRQVWNESKQNFVTTRFGDSLETLNRFKQKSTVSTLIHFDCFLCCFPFLSFSFSNLIFFFRFSLGLSSLPTLYRKLTEKFDIPNGCNRTTISGRRSNFLFFIFFYLFASGGSPTPHPISLPTSFCM